MRGKPRIREVEKIVRIVLDGAVLEGVNVAQQEILDALVKEELDPQRTRVRERNDETGEFARCSADADLPEMRPIGLRLLARECCQSQESFLFDGTQRADQAANLNHRAGISTLLKHLVKTSGAEPEILLKGFLNEIEIRIRGFRATGRDSTKAMSLDCSPNRIGMKIERGGNRPDLQMLSVEEAANVGDQSHRDHGCVTSFREKDSRTAPAGRKNGRPRPDDPKKKTVDRARQPKKLSRAAR